MFCFFNKKKERERRMNMISAIKPTSKTSLKMQCLLICKGNVDEAKKLYDFYAEDMQGLPDYDVAPPTWLESAKDNAIGFYQFVKDNKEDIAQGIDFIRSILSRNASSANIVQEVSDVLPKINEE